MTGYKIRISRELKNITQEGLGNITGFNQSQISKIESGLRRITVKDLQKIAAALGVPLAELLDESPPKAVGE